MNTTKDVRRLALGVTIGLAAFATPWMAGAVANVLAVGTLTLVGDIQPDSSMARTRLRMKGQCNGKDVGDHLYIIVRSGTLNGASAEVNSVSMKNAHSTLLAALLSGKTVSIWGLSTCMPNAQDEVILDLPTAEVQIETK